MKRVIRFGKKLPPQVRVSIVENAATNTVTLSIDILPMQKSRSRRVRHKRKTNPRPHANGIKQYAARPVVGYMNIAQKIEIGRRIYLHMMNNPDFADAYPPPKALLVATDTLDEAYYYALIGGEAEKRRLGRVEEDFDRTYLNVVHYVDKKANGREEIYRSAGIEPILVNEKRRNPS